MRFGKAQVQKFGTEFGAYSIVTNRENYDSQITITDFEADLVIKHFGRENIHVGNVQSDPEKASKPFRLYKNGSLTKLNLVFPKPEKPELRLYISARSGFKPKGGEVWFMFIKDGELYIGSQTEKEWRAESSIFKADYNDDIYQDELNETDIIKIGRLRARDVYKRDRRIALKRLVLSEFHCEYDKTHSLFISRGTRKPYLEAHHLIPIGLQKEFKKPLDNIHNVFCLCPRCHSAIHHAEEKLARQILSGLSEKRPVLNKFSLKLEDLFGLYAVEEITNR